MICLRKKSADHPYRAGGPQSFFKFLFDFYLTGSLNFAAVFGCRRDRYRTLFDTGDFTGRGNFGDLFGSTDFPELAGIGSDILRNGFQRALILCTVDLDNTKCGLGQC